MPHFPQVYCLTTVGLWIVPVVTKARNPWWKDHEAPKSVIPDARKGTVHPGHLVTLIVSLCDGNRGEAARLFAAGRG
jgi:hypothetical protein